MDHGIDPKCRVNVLAVSPLGSDHVALAHIFGHTAWKLETAHSLREATVQLAAPRLDHPPVILCDENLGDGTWKDLLAIVQELSEPHNLIVTSDHADERLWAEVLNLGAYDVLRKPFRSQEIYRAIGCAWTDRRKPQSRTQGSGRQVLGTGAVA